MINLKKHLVKQQSASYFSNQNGAILITLIFAAVLAAVVSLSAISMQKTSTDTQFGSLYALQTYLMAEAGGRFAADYVNAGNNLDNLNNLTYTFSDNAGSFTIQNVDYTDITTFNFTSISTSDNGDISKTVTYENFTSNEAVSADLTGNSNNHVSSGGSTDQEETFDGDTGNRGYRSQTDGNSNNGNSYIGYDFGAGSEQAITSMQMWQDGDGDTRVNSVLVQYSDNNSSWDTAATVDVSGGRIQTFTNPYSGEHRYWRVLANSGTNGGEEWNVNELEMMSGGPTPVSIQY